MILTFTYSDYSRLAKRKMWHEDNQAYHVHYLKSGEQLKINCVRLRFFLIMETQMK